MAEQLANNARTTVASGLANVTNPVTFVVASAGGFPTSGNFRIIVDAEILLVTAVAGTSFTASRAQEGTAAASHATGADVTDVLTAGSLVQAIADGFAAGNGAVTLTYGATISAPDAAVGNWFIVSVTNTAAHAYPAPLNPRSGKMITLTLFNFGGAIATATFHSTYRTGGYAPPANGSFTSATFLSNGFDWYQVTPWTPGIVA